jgi:phenylacetate-coenzyme A ligase PaaK-like adenylate-forming protein
VAISSGSTGEPGVLLFDPAEWVGLLAASASQRRLAGPPAGPRRAKVASPSPWHLSAQLGATLQDPRKPSLRLGVDRPLPDLVAELGRFRPDVLDAQPSTLVALAAEQRAGRLAIAPGQVFAGGEVLTDAARRRIADAWGTEPFDEYVTTEAGAVAGECGAHAGLHIVDDHVLVEVVDEQHRPVPPGTFGAAVLVTVLSSRTLPLIRYELADSACLRDDPCPCGRPGPRIAAIAGQARELLRLPGADGLVSIHPTVLTPVLDAAPVAAWQVTQRGSRLRVAVTGPAPDFDPAVLAGGVRAALDDAGVTGAPVDLEVVERLPRRASGKAARFVVESNWV